MKRRLLAWTGVLVFVTVAYFDNQRPESNALSQFNLTRAIVERGTLSIDAYHTNTLDKSFFAGHYYCDKSPVNAFLGVPALALYHALAARNQSLDENRARYWTTCSVEATSAALLAMMVAAALGRRAVPRHRAALAATLWVAATPLLGYAVVFYNYLPACAMLMGGYLLAEPAWSRSGTLSRRRLFCAGLLLGLAAWTLNTMAIAAVVMTFPLLAAARPGGDAGAAWRRAWQRSAPWVLGGLVGAAGYFAYNYKLFGSFASPYAYEADPFFREQMSRGLMGAMWPRPFVAWLLTMHKFQGLFLWFPLTALAAIGAMWRIVRPEGESSQARVARAESLVALLVFAALLAYSSGYYMWWGGYAYAPRHLIPALPLLALGMAPWLREGRLASARLALALAFVSAVFNTTAVAVNPQPWPGLQTKQLLAPESVAHWPSPYLTLQFRFWILGTTDRNWGYVLGLHDRASLVPLAALWAGACGMLFRWRLQVTGKVCR